jgi:ribosomal protein S18 acetylase RimI-like enzyme
VGPAYLVRPDAAADHDFLAAILLDAAFWRPGQVRPPLAAALRDPMLARYLDGWGRAGDAGLVAVRGSERLGAAMHRLFDPERPGYGFVGAGIPEVTIGVVAAERGQGVGTALLRGLIREARDRGYPALSLSVEFDNAALRLYQRLGFRRVGGVDNAWTMLVDL